MNATRNEMTSRALLTQALAAAGIDCAIRALSADHPATRINGVMVQWGRDGYAVLMADGWREGLTGEEAARLVTEAWKRGQNEGYDEVDKGHLYACTD